MAKRLRLSAIVLVVGLVVGAHVSFAMQPGEVTWNPGAAMSAIGLLGGLAAATSLALYGRRRSPGWNVAWLIATTSVAVQALGLGRLAVESMGVGLAQMIQDEKAQVLLGPLDDPLGTALFAAGTAGMTAALWLMIRERLVITFATDFLAEGLIMGVALAYLFAVSGLAMTGGGGPEDSASLLLDDAVRLLPLVFTVAAWWLMTRLTRLTSEAPVAYRWLGLSLLVLVLPAALFAVGVLVVDPPRGIVNTTAVRAIPLLHTVGTALWLAASLDPSLARPFDPVPVPDRAAVAHVPMLLVLGALGPLLSAWAIIAMAPSGGGLVTDLDVSPPLLLFGSLLLPMVTAAQLIRRVHIEYSTVTRDNHDSLTGLADAASFRTAVAEALDRATNRPAVLYLDLDRFKAINDSLGHDVGDQLLRAVAKRLARALPPKALPGRLGGDEFAVLLPNINQVREAEELADAIIESFKDRHRIENRDLFVGTSVGIAIGSRGIDADELIKHADKAMYRAKRRRDHKRVTYSSQLDFQAQLRLALESELRAAVEKNAFTLYYQPKVDASTHQVTGYEALIRWRHPKLGILPPASFLPIAEETGLVGIIGDWVLMEACRVLRAWQSADRRMVPIAVNISPRQIAGTDLFTLVSAALERTGADPNYLEIELTESTLLEDLDGVASSLAKLRDLGVKVALDDFGTGYSALSYLQRIQFDWIKLDRTFVQSVGRSGSPQPVVGAVLAMAQQLGTPVVAEGVETAAQARWLSQSGAAVLQGYLFGRPEPLAIYDTLAETRPPRATNSPMLLAIGLDIHRMRRILADIAVDSTPDATQKELEVLRDALVTESPYGAFDFRRRRPPTWDPLRSRRAAPSPEPTGRPIAAAAPLTPGQIARGPVARPASTDLGPLDLGERPRQPLPPAPPATPPRDDQPPSAASTASGAPRAKERRAPAATPDDDGPRLVITPPEAGAILPPQPADATPAPIRALPRTDGRGDGTLAG